MIQLVGNERTVQLFGIKLVGVSLENGRKLIFTIAFLVLLIGLRKLLSLLLHTAAGKKERRVQFWVQQSVRLLTAVVLIVGLISIWFTDPSRLASAAALITAGLAVASQKVIGAISGYFIILRGKNFNVGDRIVMGGVRGDVIALGFMQTTIMEMGQPPPEQGDAPSMWVAGRQYTGRVVTITNDKIFDEPVYNYSSDFPYIWEEMRLPIPYNSNHRHAEKIIVEAARRHTSRMSEVAEDALKELERRYLVKREELEPRVYIRLTDNWVEMSVRFLAESHGVRKLKDAMSRDILDAFEGAGIGMASGTYEVVGMPEVKVSLTGPGATRQPERD